MTTRDPVNDSDQVRSALAEQWRRIAVCAEHLDLDRPSRIAGWRNAEVLSHLAIQPVLLARFLARADLRAPTMRLEDNLAGTGSLADAINQAAREGVTARRWDFARQVISVESALRTADLAMTITTIQGRLRLEDYLRTRCLEAVVHGRDLQPPVPVDPAARSITAYALLTLLHDRPDELAEARQLPEDTLIDMATGRSPASARLAHVMPLMR